MPAPTAQIALIEREPDKVGGFVWGDPAAPPAGLSRAIEALLALPNEQRAR
jgi:hypothetical protein